MGKTGKAYFDMPAVLTNIFMIHLPSSGVLMYSEKAQALDTVYLISLNEILYSSASPFIFISLRSRVT